MTTLKQLFSVSLLILTFIGPVQGQITINGDRGLVMIVNHTSNFAVSAYRVLVPLTTLGPSTTPGLPTTPGSSIPTTTTQTTPKTTPTTPSSTATVSLSVIGLKEVDSDWNPITGYSVTRDDLMARSYTPNAAYQAALSSDLSLQASCNQFIAQPVSGVPSSKGTLNVTLCTAVSNGTIVKRTSTAETASSETENIADGQILMMVTVMDWPWCSSCSLTGSTNQSGAYLNVDLEVIVNKAYKIMKTMDTAGQPVRYSLGADAYLDLGRMITYDNTTGLMQTKFPSMTPTDGQWKSTFTFSLTRFQTSGSFCMILDPGNQPGPKSGGQVVGGASKISTVSSFLIGCAMMIGISSALSLIRIY